MGRRDVRCLLLTMLFIAVYHRREYSVLEEKSTKQRAFIHLLKRHNCCLADLIAGAAGVRLNPEQRFFSRTAQHGMGEGCDTWVLAYENEQTKQPARYVSTLLIDCKVHRLAYPRLKLSKDYNWAVLVVVNARWRKDPRMKSSFN